MEDDSDCLRGKYILVCRTSGVHRLPIYQRAASKGPWAEPQDRITTLACPWTYSAEPIPNHATRGGYGAKLIFLHPSRVPFCEEVATDWIIEDTADASKCLAAVKAWGERQGPGFPGFAGVACFDEFSLTTAAALSEALGLKGVTPLKTVNSVRNKLKMREMCAQIGLPQPRSLRFRISDVARGLLSGLLGADGAAPGVDTAAFGPEAAATAADAKSPQSCTRLRTAPCPESGTDADWGSYYSSIHSGLRGRALQYPLVVKPLSGAGSNFVRKVASFDELVSVLSLFSEQCDEVAQSPTGSLGGVVGADLTAAAPCPFAAAAIAAAKAAAESGSAPPSGSAAAAQAPAQSMLMFRWRHWGLSQLDSAFMLEEYIDGDEFDVDFIVQHGVIKVAQVNFNYPTAATAGHRSYFMEAGGLIPAVFPLREQLGARAMAQRFVSAFGGDMCGAMHFEGMIARNASWAEQDPALVAAGLAGPGFCIMPIEVNQRLGGSEVCCLNTVVTGVDYGLAALKVACDVPLPNYFSLLPSSEYMNRLGWDRVPGALSLCDAATRGLYTGAPDVATPDVIPAPAPVAAVAAATLPGGVNAEAAAAAELVAAAEAAAASAAAEDAAKRHTAAGVPLPARAESWTAFLSRRYGAAAAAATPASATATTSASTPKPTDYVYTVGDTVHAHAERVPTGDEYPECPPLHLGLPLPVRLTPVPATLTTPESAAAAAAVAAVRGSSDDVGTGAAVAASPVSAELGTLLQLAMRLTRELRIPPPNALYPPGSSRRFRFTSSVNWVPPRSGTVSVLHMPAEAMTDPHYLGHALWYAAGRGELCEVPPAGFDFLGWLVAGGDTAEEAQEHLFRLSAMLRWDIEPVAAASADAATVDTGVTGGCAAAVAVAAADEIKGEPVATD